MCVCACVPACRPSVCLSMTIGHKSVLQLSFWRHGLARPALVLCPAGSPYESLVVVCYGLWAMLVTASFPSRMLRIQRGDRQGRCF